MARFCSLILLVLLSGCLVSQVEQYTLVINKDGRTGTLTVVRRNLQSDSEDTTQQRKDFEELLENRSSDAYLLRQLDQGFYVKERSLKSEHGVLVWREKMLVADITKLLPDYQPGRPIHLTMHDTAGVSIRTNGHLLAKNDSLIIEWPADAERLELTSAKRQFSPASNFFARFQARRGSRR